MKIKFCNPFKPHAVVCANGTVHVRKFSIMYLCFRYYRTGRPDPNLMISRPCEYTNMGNPRAALEFVKSLNIKEPDSYDVTGTIHEN